MRRRPPASGRWALAALALAPLAACGEADMTDQPRAKTWDGNAFLPRQMTMQAPVAGTVPRDDPARAAPQPARVTPALLERGRERYAVFCTPCHGGDGAGRGMVVRRGYPQPEDLAAPRLRAMRAARLYGAVSDGAGAMVGMAQMIPSADRWAIVAYVRALQRARDVAVADLPEADRARLEAAR